MFFFLSDFFSKFFSKAIESLWDERQLLLIVSCVCVCMFFFSSHFSTHIYSVKRSRHNVWTLCINLIELQLFFETLESIRRKSRRNDHTEFASWIFYSRIWIGISNSCSGSIGNAVRFVWLGIAFNLFFWRAPIQIDREKDLCYVYSIIIPYEMNSNSVKLIQKVFRFFKKKQAMRYTKSTTIHHPIEMSCVSMRIKW